jgi:hypothetical protein
MALEKTYIRKGGEVIGSVTSGYADKSTTVRDSGRRVVGHTSDRFNTTRDSNGKLVSTNAANSGLLIRKK